MTERLLDTVSKHRISKTTPSALSNVAEVLHALASTEQLSRDALLSRVHEEYEARFHKCGMGQIKLHLEFLAALDLLCDSPTPRLEASFAQGCYDSSFTPDAKVDLLVRFYLHSRLFRDLCMGLSRAEESMDELFRRLDNVHGLNSTARPKFREWVRALSVAEEWLGKASIARWLQEKILTRIKTDELVENLNNLRKEYGEQYYLTQDTFEQELMGRVFLYQVNGTVAKKLVSRLDQTRVIALQAGKENKKFVHITNPELLPRGFALGDFIQTESLG